MKSPIEKTNGACQWQEKPGDTYLVTDIDCDGKRFRRSGGWRWISCINVWRGSFWLVRDGRRFLIRRVFN
jgi:hypothetical protein